MVEPLQAFPVVEGPRLHVSVKLHAAQIAFDGRRGLPRKVIGERVLQVKVLAMAQRICRDGPERRILGPRRVE